jgi:hypothetical protein
MVDQWDTSPSAPSSEKAYSPRDFYTAGSDQRGHHSSRRVTLPPDLDGQLAALVASRKYPHYVTIADVLRDAIVRKGEDADAVSLS